MSRASELMKLPGAVAAGVFSRKGLLDDFEGPFSQAQAELLMNLCASMTITMEMQGRLWPIWRGYPVGIPARVGPYGARKCPW